MPLYHYECDCGNTSRRIAPASKQDDLVVCSCGQVMRRAPKPMTTNVMEVLDNGLMPRKLERLADAQRLYKERSKIDPLKDD